MSLTLSIPHRPAEGNGCVGVRANLGSPMALQLYGMSFTPYSERARWALDHHRVPYEWHEHVPMVGERSLRKRAGGQGKASVPLALDGETVLRDSLAIAR